MIESALATVAGALLAATPVAVPPATAPTVHFAVKGDWGYGGASQAAVTRQMCASNARSRFAFVLTTGDNFYRPDGVATDDNFTRPERCLVRSGVRWRATWGNHDLGGDSTATALGSPQRRYQFASGPVRLIVLDGNRPDDPAQVAFLRRALQAAREPVKIVAVHQPVYTAGLHEPSEAGQRLWTPLFRRHGVSLVLSGHNHAYERMVVDGITYITTGGGGAPIYPCVRPAPGLKRCLLVNHFLLVDAAETGIGVRVVGKDGATVERVTVPVRRPAP